MLVSQSQYAIKDEHNYLLRAMMGSCRNKYGVVVINSDKEFLNECLIFVAEGKSNYSKHLQGDIFGIDCCIVRASVVHGNISKTSSSQLLQSKICGVYLLPNLWENCLLPRVKIRGDCSC